MVLENKLGITNSAQLADMEEKLTKTLYDSTVGNHIIVDEQVDEDEIIDFKLV